MAELAELCRECFFKLLLGVLEGVPFLLLPGVVTLLLVPDIANDLSWSSLQGLLLGATFGRFGWNLRKEAQAMASWTIPSCHIKAANTALRAWATEGDIASLTGSFGPGREPDRDLGVPGIPPLSLGTGDTALSRLVLSTLLLSLRLVFGDNLKNTSVTFLTTIIQR